MKPEIIQGITNYARITTESMQTCDIDSIETQVVKGAAKHGILLSTELKNNIVINIFCTISNSKLKHKGE